MFKLQTIKHTLDKNLWFFWLHRALLWPLDTVKQNETFRKDKEHFCSFDYTGHYYGP